MQTTLGWMGRDRAPLRRTALVMLLATLLLVGSAVSSASGAAADGPTALEHSLQRTLFLEWNTIKLPSDTDDLPPSAPVNPIEGGWGTRF